MKYITKLILQSPRALLLQNQLACEERYHLYKIQLTFGDLLVPAFGPVPPPWRTVLQSSVCWGFQWDACTFLHWACYCLWSLCSLGTTSSLRNSSILSGSGPECKAPEWGSCTSLHGTFELCHLSTVLCVAKKKCEPKAFVVISLKSFPCRG